MPNSNGKILDRLTTKNVIYVILIGLLCLALCGYDLRWIIPASILVIGLIIYSIFDQNRKVTEIVLYMD